MDFDKLLHNLAYWPHLTPAEMPHDPEACKSCAYSNANFTHVGGSGSLGYCYMLKEIPTTLCMIFKKS